MKLTLIAIAGTNGAGKDTVGQLLARQLNYMFATVSDSLREEARRRGLAVERENLRMISAEWRREFGVGVLVDRAIERFDALKETENYRGLVVCPMRNPGEAQRVKDLGGVVIWVDADPKLRYERIRANVAVRNRAEEDDKTFEQFLAEEAAEMTTTGDAATLDMGAVRALANVTIINEFPNYDLLARELKLQFGYLAERQS